MGLREAVLAGVVAVPFGLGLTAAADDGPKPLLRFLDPEIVESSGLVARDGLLQTVNDSGDEARVFTVDRQGRTVGVSRWDGEAVDVEALAPGAPGRVWVGDIGDNARERDTISVTSVPVGRGDRSGPTRTYRLAHPDGPVDAESLLAHPETGTLYVVTKGVLGGQLLAAPRELDPERVNRLYPIGPVLGLATDGAFLPDGRHLVVRDYSRAVVYTFPGLEVVGQVDLPAQEQGEGIAVDDDGRLLLSSEGVEAPVLAVDLPPEVARAVAGESEPRPRPERLSVTVTPSPDADAGSDGSEGGLEAQPLPREPWKWLLGAGVLVVMVVVLLRSLRPR